MSDSPTNYSSDDDFSSSSLFVQVNSNSNYSINGTFDSSNDKHWFSNELMGFITVVIATITVLICLAVCTIICICVCLKRKRKSKQKKIKDQLLSEQSNKTSKVATNNSTTANGKQGSLDQIVNSNPIKSSMRPFYYDNLDDIPFIDESRPTSVVDITQV